MNRKNWLITVIALSITMTCIAVWRGSGYAYAAEDNRDVAPREMSDREFDSGQRCEVVLRSDAISSDSTRHSSTMEVIKGSFSHTTDSWIVLGTPEMKRRLTGNEDATVITGNECEYWIPVRNVLYYRVWKR